MPTELAAVRRVFRAEAQEQLAEMERSLLALEASPEDGEALRRAFRALHTLKGSALTVGLGALAEFAHGVEDLLERLRDGRLQAGRMVVSLLLECTDALRALSGSDAAPDPADAAELERLARRIAAVRGMSTAPQRPAAAPAGAERSAPAAGAEPAEPGARAGAPLRVAAEKLDALFALADQIARAHAAFHDLLRELQEPEGEKLRDAFREPARLGLELQKRVQQLRRVPLGPLLAPFARVVRDLSLALEKRVRVEVRGEDVELDASVVAALRAPLTHLVSNALAHGIESPEEREQRGKSPWGSLTLHAARRAGGVVIECTDDGRGLDRERIVARARERGLVADPALLDDQALGALLFEEGFSTAASVTELSGRGVGLGAVKSDVEALGGSVRLSGVAGAGTTVSIYLPASASRSEVLELRAGAHSYLVPLACVTEFFDLPAQARGQRTGVLALPGEALPWARLADVLGSGGDEAAAAPSRLIALAAGGAHAAIAVERVEGVALVLPRPLAADAAAPRGVLAEAALGGGRLGLLLDASDIVARVRRAAAAPTAEPGSATRRAR